MTRTRTVRSLLVVLSLLTVLTLVALLVPLGCARTGPAGPEAPGAPPPAGDGGSANPGSPPGSPGSDTAGGATPPAGTPCPLCGRAAAAKKVDRVPLAVVLDNHPEARPQDGLGSACLVYEFPVEGGFTRLLAFFLHEDAPSVGPVRSARDYMIEPCLEMAAVLCHIGGSPQAYERLGRLTLRDLDDMKGAGAYWRVSYRRSPHNLYTSTASLRRAAESRGWTRGNWKGWGLAPDPAAALPGQGEPAMVVSLRYPGIGGPYLGYRYNPDKAAYIRFVSGEPHRDPTSSQPLSAANLLVVRTLVTPIPGDAEGRVKVQMVGEGDAVLFRGGRAYRGRWSKSSPLLPTRIAGASGPLPLGPGPTWVEVVPAEAPLEWR